MTTRRKRSADLRLVLMAAAVPVALAGCESEPTGRLFQSVEECSVEGEIDIGDCRSAYETALGDHRTSAPRFQSESECNQQFGGCERVGGDWSDGTTSATSTDSRQGAYIPPLGGFLVGYYAGQMLDIDGRRKKRYRTSGVLPLYRDFRSGEYLKPNGDSVGRTPGLVRGDAGRTTGVARGQTVSRGGFGSTASSSSSRSSFGG